MGSRTIRPCRNCGEPTPHESPSTSHVLHLLLSVFTAGVWLPVWLLIALNNNGQAACTVCGRQVGLFGSSRGGAKGLRPTPKTHVKCPDCAELVKREARVCKHCGSKLAPQ